MWDKLAATGELDETIIVFTSDNGYMQGEHRWQSGKVIGFDPSYRVPLLIAGPGVPQGTRHYAPVSTMDVTASVLDWTGAQLAGVDGRSFVGDLGANVGWDRAVGYEAHFPGLANRRATVFDDARRAIGIRTARYFYVRYANGQAELFDLERDPLQLASVARDPAYAATRRSLDVAWNAFKDCRGADCQIPLAPALRESPRRTAELREKIDTASARYYG